MKEILKFSISDLFKSLREHGLDPDHTLLWGYYFVDRDPDKLMELARKLSRDGYHLSSLAREPDGEHYRLYLEKIEIHSPRSLDERNQELQRIADDLRVMSYDGSDVGPLPEDEVEES
ncbi:MAG: ribonuclease E inhibitor RraB [Myxococcales bacterium]|nr:ribonuclease E inhibitor RraB [Myxococcales bacterium]